MTTMVERVARAIFEADIASTQKDFPNTPETILRIAGEALFKDHHIPMARAAIEAMREPSIFMLRRADNAIISDERFESGPYESDKFTWETMIDAALNEEG